MTMKSILSAGLGAVALGLVATAAQAAPVSSLIGAVDRDAARSGAVENVTWGRRCHWHRGYRHCWYGHRYHRWHHRYGHRRGW